MLQRSLACGKDMGGLTKWPRDDDSRSHGTRTRQMIWARFPEFPFQTASERVPFDTNKTNDTETGATGVWF